MSTPFPTRNIVYCLFSFYSVFFCVACSNMKQVRFVVLDLVVDEDEQGLALESMQAFRDSTVRCLRELAHYIAAPHDSAPSSSAYFLSLIVATSRDEPAQVRQHT
jgi:hypothetical protein